jgi:tetratricopeptide (TPR) repeat protein
MKNWEHTVFLFRRGFLLLVIAQITAAHSASAQTFRYNVEYKCNGERIAVGHCRKDSDTPGFPATTPDQDYCSVYYPDRPKRGGFTVETVELRGDVIKKLQACGALAASQLTSAPSADTPQRNASADSYMTQANKYLDDKQYAKAIEAYKQVVALQPSSGAYLALGYAYYNLSQYQEALPAFEKAVRLKPDDSSYHYWTGVTYYQLKQYPKALTELQEATRLNPKDAYGHHWLGEVYLTGFKQYEKAVTAYLECRRLNPDDARNHNELGLAYDNLRKYENALAEFKEAVRLKPDEPLYQSNLGIAYVRLKKVNEAEKVSTALEKLDKKMAESLDKQIFAVMYDMKHEKDQGSNKPEAPAKASRDSDAKSYLAQGKKYLDAEDYPKAIEIYKKALALNPNAEISSDAYYEIGYSYVEQERYPEAITALRESLRLESDSTDANLVLGRAYYRLKRYPEAITSLKKSISLDPKYATSYYYLGTVYYDQGKSELAVSAFKQALALKPTGAGLLSMIAMGLEVTQQYDDALETFRDVVRLSTDPDLKALAYHDMGWIYNKTKQYREALTALREAVRLNPNDASGYDELGTAYQNVHQMTNALESFQKSVLLKPDNAAVQYHLGVVCFLLSKKNEAFQAYKALLALDKAKAKELHDVISAKWTENAAVNQ